VELVLVLAVFLTQACFANELGWNQKARLAAAFAFVETGTFRIDHFFQNEERGLVTGDWAKSGDHYYSNKAPGASMLAIAPYFLAFHAEKAFGKDPRSKDILKKNSWLINLSTTVLWNALSAAFIFAAFRGIGQTARDSMLGALVYSFGTLVFPFGGSVWGHTISAAFIVLSVFFWLSATKLAQGPAQMMFGVESSSAFCGFFAAWAVLTEYLAGIAFILIGLTFLLKRERWNCIPYFAIGSLVPLSLLLGYHQIYFGNILTTATSLSNPEFLDEQKVGGVFWLPSGYVVAELVLLPYRGLIPFMPVLLMSAVGFWRLINGRYKELGWLCLSVVAITILIVSCFNGWHGGVSSGPRYLIIVLPFIVLMLPPLSSLNPITKLFYILTGCLSVLNMWVIASTTVLAKGENPLYGELYNRFGNAQISAQTLQMFLGWRGPWSVALVMGVCFIFAGTLLWNVRNGSSVMSKYTAADRA
jgi:hypothetical protein